MDTITISSILFGALAGISTGATGSMIVLMVITNRLSKRLAEKGK